MLQLRKSGDRGHVDLGWLNSRHTFSFGHYYDPEEMGFSVLRVINDDYIQPGMGFGTHGHTDMEIITYVLDGELAHKDSMGNGSSIRPGDVQRMSAGKGVQHSEFNHSGQVTHLLQIWIEPNVLGITPGYEEKNFSADDKRNRLLLVASKDGRDGSVLMHQDASMYAGLFDGVGAVVHPLASGRCAYVHVARGSITINGERLDAGDGARITATAAVELSDGDAAEVLLFDLP